MGKYRKVIIMGAVVFIAASIVSLYSVLKGGKEKKAHFIINNLNKRSSQLLYKKKNSVKHIKPLHKYKQLHKVKRIHNPKQPHILKQLPKQLYIENYIFTKFMSNRALIRVYGTNRSNKSVSHFPVVIKYYDKNGRYLGEDKSDLLLSTKRILKPGGKLNAELSVTYPENTDRIDVAIQRD